MNPPKPHQVENLLESYYMLVDSTHHKLNGIGGCGMTLRVGACSCGRGAGAWAAGDLGWLMCGCGGGCGCGDVRRRTLTILSPVPPPLHCVCRILRIRVTPPPPGEYIDDTEDYINIELDYSRNRLLRLEIMITVRSSQIARAQITDCGLRGQGEPRRPRAAAVSLRLLVSVSTP